MSRILVLGAGAVSGPAVAHLLRRGFRVTVADAELGRAMAVVGGEAGGEALGLDVGDAQALEAAVLGHELVVSLLPAALHPTVAAACLRTRRALLTTSYVGPELRALHQPAAQAGLLFLNEMGLDPGLDHLLVQEVVAEARRRGEQVRSLATWCGGLPAPGSDEVPFRYRFSWNPRTALLSATRSAVVLEGGTRREVPASELEGQLVQFELPGVGRLEGYPNRDAVHYREAYGIPEVTELVRGTLRYPGSLGLFRGLAELGLLAEGPARGWGPSEREYLEQVLGGRWPKVAEERLGERGRAVAQALAALGLGGERPLGVAQGAPVDVLAGMLGPKLAYRPGDRDLVILWVELTTQVGGRTVVRRRRVVQTGADAHRTAMALTVGLPAGVAAELMARGRLGAKGVLTPCELRLHEQVLPLLEQGGIRIEREESA